MFDACVKCKRPGEAVGQFGNVASDGGGCHQRPWEISDVVEMLEAWEVIDARTF